MSEATLRISGTDRRFRRRYVTVTSEQDEATTFRTRSGALREFYIPDGFHLEVRVRRGSRFAYGDNISIAALVGDAVNPSAIPSRWV